MISSLAYSQCILKLTGMTMILLLLTGCPNITDNESEKEPDFLNLEPGTHRVQIGSRIFEGRATVENSLFVGSDVHQIKLEDVGGGRFSDGGVIRIIFLEGRIVPRTHVFPENPVLQARTLATAYHNPDGMGWWGAREGSVTIHSINEDFVIGTFEITFRRIDPIILRVSPIEVRGGFHAKIILDQEQE